MDLIIQEKRKNYTIRATSCLKRMAQDIIELGHIAHEYHSEFGYQDYISWVKNDLKLGSTYGQSLLNVYDHFNSTTHCVVENFDSSALRLLAAPATPESAREESLSMAKNGDKISHKDSKEIVGRHKALEKELAELKAENTRLKTDGTKSPANTANLIPGIKVLLESGVIMPAMALNISTMTDEGQQAWLTLRSENLSLENQLREGKTRLEELESREPETIERIVEVMPEGAEEKILDADKKLKEANEKNRQADKVLKTIKQLQDEKSALELKAAQLNKERNELERTIKTHEAKEQTLTPGAIDDSRAVKLDRLVKELDWIFPDILKENEIAGGYMPRSKDAISEIIRKWSSILIEIGGQSVIDI